jgi:hypothetical protein
MTRRKSGKPTPKELLALRGNAAVKYLGQRFPPGEPPKPKRAKPDQGGGRGR